MKLLTENLNFFSHLAPHGLSLFSHKQRKSVEKILSKGGIRINGRRPWDIRVLNEKFFDRVLAEGSLGLGESYMEAWWECERLDEMMNKLLRAKIDRTAFSWPLLWDTLKAKAFNLQEKSKSFLNAQKHYDIGNDLYEKMLDPRMVYSCAYWRGAASLTEAQENKLELCCRKLELKPGMKILDIGCGWGSFARYAAEKHHVKVLGITVCRNQFAFARQQTRGLDVEIRLQDYRDLKDGKFDRIVSIGMFEHVGYKNYQNFMKIVNRSLKKDGVFLLHTIGRNQSTTHMDPWIHRYIFPNSMLPSIKQIGESVEDLFLVEDWHNFGPDYDRTLVAWFENFHKNWDSLKSKYSKKFYRMWKFYLLSCAGAFRAREMQVWQILLSKSGTNIHRHR